VIAEHLFRESTTAIKEVVFQKLPNSTIWVLRADGTLCCCSYRADQEVLAWAEVETDGTVQSMALLTTADEDELWILVDRGTVRQVEKLTADFSGETTEEARFLDCWIEFDGRYDASTIPSYDFTTDQLYATNVVSGFVGKYFRVYDADGEYIDVLATGWDAGTPLFLTCTIQYSSYAVNPLAMAGTYWTEIRNYVTCAGAIGIGTEVSVIGDGTYIGTETVANLTHGTSIEVDTYHERLVIGLPYNFDFQTLPIAVATKNGGGMELQTQIQEGHISVYQARGGGIGPNNGNIATINFDTIIARDLKWSFIDEEGDLYSLPLFTGGVKFTFDGNASNEANLFFRQSEPYPCTVRALNLKVEVSDT